jgi:hypothetical protein
LIKHKMHEPDMAATNLSFGYYITNSLFSR